MAKLFKARQHFDINYTPDVVAGEVAFLGIAEGEAGEEIIVIKRTSPVVRVKHTRKEERIYTQNSVYYRSRQ